MVDPRDRARLRTALIVIGLGAAAGLAIFRIPLQSIFVLGIVLLCPLLMLGLHASGGHGQGSHAGHEDTER